MSHANAANSATHATAGSCARCGYSTVGLTSLVCPECGGDFRDVGIVTPQAPSMAARSFVGRALMFTLFFVPAAMFFIAVLATLLPQPATFSSDIQLLTPASGQYKSVTVSARASGWAELGMSPTSLTLTLQPGPATGNVPPAPLVFPASTANTVISRDAVLAWMRVGRINVSDPRVVTEARRVAAEARSLARSRPLSLAGNYGSSNSGSGSSSSGFGSFVQSESSRANLPEDLRWVLFGVAVLVWAAGLLLLRHRPAEPPLAHRA